MWIGKDIGKDVELCPDIGITWLKDSKFKVLGIEYDLEKENIIESNYEIKLESIRKLLSTWGWRFLTIFGKLIIIKNLAIPLLVHLFRALPNPSDTFFKKLNTICYDFIWDKKPDKIKRSIMISDYSDGGLRMLHLESFAKSLKIYWVKSVMNDLKITEWKSLLLDKLIKSGGNVVWNYHPTAVTSIAKNLNPFWENIFNTWAELHTEPNNFQSQPIWFNPAIKAGGETIFYRQWSTAGINFVNDLINEQGRLLDQEEFENLYNIEENFVSYYSVISAIPREWKEVISNEGKLEEVDKNVIKLVTGLKKPNKVIYFNSIENIKEDTSILQEKWITKINDQNFDIKIAFETLHKYLKGTVLKAFQYKLLHRILPTNRSLYKMGIINYNCCHFCRTHVESIEHLFFECNDVKNLWFYLSEEFLLKNYFENLKIDLNTILFGYNDQRNLSCINIFIALIKVYIFNCKIKDKQINNIAAKNYLKYYCEIYKNLDNQNNEWSFYDDYMARA